MPLSPLRDVPEWARPRTAARFVSVEGWMPRRLFGTGSSNLFADRVVTARIVVRGVLFAADELLRGWSALALRQVEIVARPSSAFCYFSLHSPPLPAKRVCVRPRMEQLAVCARAHLVDNRGLQVEENRPRNVLPCTGLGEERVEPAPGDDAAPLSGGWVVGGRWQYPAFNILGSLNAKLGVEHFDASQFAVGN
eukprot:gene17965-biopygen14218